MFSNCPHLDLNPDLSELDGKEAACSAGDGASIPGLGRSPGEGNGIPLQYFCLGNPMDRGAWRVIVYGVTESAMTEQLTYCLTPNSALLPYILLLEEATPGPSGCQALSLVPWEWRKGHLHEVLWKALGFSGWHSGVSSGDLLCSLLHGEPGLALPLSFISVVTLTFLCQTGISLVPWFGSPLEAPLQPLAQASHGTGCINTCRWTVDGSGLSFDG